MKTRFWAGVLIGLAPPVNAWAPFPANSRQNARSSGSAIVKVESTGATDSFTTWAISQGVDAPLVEVAVFPGGGRGVRATSEIEGGSPLMTVPKKLTLETTTLSRQPPASFPEGWVPPEAWAGAKWYVRLALLLLHEKQRGASSPLLIWLDALPTIYDFRESLPLHWSEDECEELQYEPLLDAIEKQRNEYRAAFDSCALSTGVTFDEFSWALHCVRSRAFSGAWEGSAWEERAIQAGFTAALATGALAVGMVEPAQVINGVLAVGLTTVMRDYLVMNSGNLKRYVLCPFVDMMNHRGNYVSDVAYEYFGNGFSATVNRRFVAGEEVCISYGKRSNDQLMQFYGFTETDNPNDQYEVRGLLELVDAALPGGVAPGRLALLKEAGLLDAVRTGTATPSGFVDATRRAVRALVATDDEVVKAGGGAAGCAALANAAGMKAGLTGSSELDARLDAALATACEIELEKLPSTFSEDLARLRASSQSEKLEKTGNNRQNSGGGFASNSELYPRTKLALQFRLEKKRVLRSCMETLRC